MKISDFIKLLIPYRIKFTIKNKLKIFFYCKETYSQCGEDIIISSIFESKNIKNISYIDIGANHPYYISNTAKFYTSSNAKTCILIEPNARLANELKRARPNDTVLNIGISPYDKREILKFYVMNADVLSTFSEKEVEAYIKMGYWLVETLEIPCRGINEVLDEYYQKSELNLLSIDVEGLDYDIIASINFNSVRPNVICVETVNYREPEFVKRDDRIIDFLTSKNYHVYAQNFLNTIFVDKNYLSKVV